MKRQSAVFKLFAAVAISGAAVVYGASDGKVDICHIPPGNPANAHTINVSVHAVPAHLAHGDNLGACGGNTCSSLGGFCSSSPDSCGPAGYTPGPFTDCPSSSDVCCNQGA